MSLGPAVGIGLARFGYAVLLPAMRADLGWSYTQAGSMNTANSFGYLAGALVAAPLATRMGVGTSFRAAILMTGVGMSLSGTTSSFALLLVLRTVAGVGGAVALIAGATLAARIVMREVEPVGGLVLGLYFGGVGMGIMVMGLGLPVLLDTAPGLWRHAWIGMGLLSFVAFAPARRASLGVQALPSDRAGAGDSAIVRAAMTPSLVAYFLFGLGYITYMTFAVAFLREHAWGPWGLSAFWLVLGASTFMSGFIWPRVFPGIPAGPSLALRLGVVALGTAVPLYSSSSLGVLLSAVLFGGAFLSVVSVVTEIIRRGLDQRAWSAGIALFTVVFSVGQTLGPIVSGAVADATGRLSSGFALSAGVLGAGVLVAAFQPDHGKGGSPFAREDRGGVDRAPGESVNRPGRPTTQ